LINAILGLLFIQTVVSVTCSAFSSCTTCVSNSACGFCGDTGVCSSGTKYGPIGTSCPGKWQYAFGSEVIQTTTGYPVTPVFADVYLYPSDPTWLQINITRPYSDDTPVDLTFLQDCSGSMSSYVKSFAAVIPNVMASVLANYRSTNFAYNAFVDKLVMNFADYSYSSNADYLFQFNTAGLDSWPGILQLAS